MKTRHTFNLWAYLWLGRVWLPNYEFDTQPYVSGSSCDELKSRMVYWWLEASSGIIRGVVTSLCNNKLSSYYYYYILSSDSPHITPTQESKHQLEKETGNLSNKTDFSVIEAQTSEFHQDLGNEWMQNPLIIILCKLKHPALAMYSKTLQTVSTEIRGLVRLRIFCFKGQTEKN